MPVPFSPEWHARKAALLAVEARFKPRWWFISFAEEAPRGFLGGVFTKAPGPVTALESTRTLGINPGGEVEVTPMRGQFEYLWLDSADRLLTRAELNRILGEVLM